jgi:hypothetical protein
MTDTQIVFRPWEQNPEIFFSKNEQKLEIRSTIENGSNKKFQKNNSDLLPCPPISDFCEVKVTFNFLKPSGHSGST